MILLGIAFSLAIWCGVSKFSDYVVKKDWINLICFLVFIFVATACFVNFSR